VCAIFDGRVLVTLYGRQERRHKGTKHPIGTLITVTNHMEDLIQMESPRGRRGDRGSEEEEEEEEGRGEKERHERKRKTGRRRTKGKTTKKDLSK
jgi:hypothetical protein